MASCPCPLTMIPDFSFAADDPILPTFTPSLHTTPAVPPQLQPFPASSPDPTGKAWAFLPSLSSCLTG